MKTKLTASLILCFLCSFGSMARGQADAQGRQGTYHVTLVPRTILAINYQNRTKTEIGFQGSPLLPLAKGHANVEGKNGRIAVDADFTGLKPPSEYGPEYLTYVMWAITPEGQTNNLGELLLSGGKSKLQATTTLQTFGVIVTAEPYYAVEEPSDVVVLENVAIGGTTGGLQQSNVNYKLFRRGMYSYNVSANPPETTKSKWPLELVEAQNAVAIAQNAGAQQYASEQLSKAQQSLTNAEGLATHGNKKEVVQYSRDSIQSAAEALRATSAAQEAQARAEERAAAAQQTAAAQAETEATKQRAELQAQKDALAKAEAERKSEQDAQAAAQAQQQAQQAQQQALQAQQAAAQAEQEKEQLRASLLEQFNRILPTTDTARGLKVNLGDVLFDTGKFDLRPPAREALAKLSGIVSAHPGLKLQIEGYTDSVGGDVFNQTLSENRANSVRAYLVNQNLDPNSITATGFGKSNPVASNDSADGRQQNRRVEIIISGEIIGTQIGHGAGNSGSQ